MTAEHAERSPETAALQRWSLADDYLADPAVAPLRALISALARRVNRARGEAHRRRPGSTGLGGRPQPA